MWTSVCGGCRIILLSLVLVVVVSEVAGQTFVALPCYDKPKRHHKIQNIISCYEQTVRKDCTTHAFIIKTSTNATYIVDPKVPWLKKLTIKCPLVISKRRW
ncbi:uncharacterized protein KZ484_017266 [Pholidichthys leucotaenia]